MSGCFITITTRIWVFIRCIILFYWYIRSLRCMGSNLYLLLFNRSSTWWSINNRLVRFTLYYAPLWSLPILGFIFRNSSYITKVFSSMPFIRSCSRTITCFRLNFYHLETWNWRNFYSWSNSLHIFLPNTKFFCKISKGKWIFRRKMLELIHLKDFSKEIRKMVTKLFLVHFFTSH